jgi:uncharacterized protein DUF4145
MRMASKTVEPQLAAVSFTCPHCNALAHQTWYSLLLNAADVRVLYHEVATREMKGLSDDDDRRRIEELAERLKHNDVTYRNLKYKGYSSAEMVNLHLSHCFSCKGFSIWVADRLVWPVRESAIEPHQDMPGTLREDFEEAAAIVNRSPRGAAALIRLCVQKLMPLLGEKGENINNDIASLVSKGLEVEIQQAMDVLRVIGNDAVHPGQIDLKDDKATAIRLFELLNLIIERRIATPQRIAALYGGLPESKRKAIEKRDQE